MKYTVTTWGMWQCRVLKIVFLLTTLAVSSCATLQTTHPGKVGVTRGQHIHPYLIEDVHYVAAHQYANLIAQTRQRGLLNRDSNQVERIRQITQHLIAQANVFSPYASDWQWEIHVISSGDVNAWCMPGGKMAIYTGFIETLQPTDDELAAVIGHEISHALRLHVVERISRQVSTGLLLTLGGRALGLDEGQEQLAELVTQLTFTLPNSRENESEADLIGLELAARAGYSPNGAITLWQKMSRLSRSNSPEFLSTHPSSDSRVRELRPYIRRVSPLYDRSRRNLAETRAPPEKPEKITETNVTDNVFMDKPSNETPTDKVSFGYLTLGTKPQAAIYINGQRVSSNPIVNFSVPAGSVHLRFEVIGERGFWSEEQTLRLSAGEKLNLGRISLERPENNSASGYAYLTLGTKPQAVIYINDHRVSSNPIVNFSVPAGLVHLRFEVNGETGVWSEEQTLRLSTGEKLNLGRIILLKR